MKHDMLRRFAFIEIRLLYGDGFTAGELGNAFGIARPNAQQTINQYRERYPKQMRYDEGRRRHVPTDGFKPGLVNQDVARFLAYQRAQNQIAYFFDDASWADLPFVDAEQAIKPRYDGNAVRQVLACLRRHKTVELDYWSRSRFITRIVSPHHLVFADGRYHIRGRCHTRNEWRDFVLTRIVRAEPCDADWIPDEEDSEWHLRVDLRFRINPDLPDDARAALRFDYLAEDQDELIIKGVRKAVAKYIIRRLSRLDAYDHMAQWVLYADDA